MELYLQHHGNFILNVKKTFIDEFSCFFLKLDG